MAVLLPTTTFLVTSPQTTLDNHGREVAYGWGQRGPFPGHREGHAPREDLLDVDRTTFPVVVLLDEAAWPVRPKDRLVDRRTDEVLEVTGASLVPDVAGRGIGHVKVTATAGF